MGGRDFSEKGGNGIPGHLCHIPVSLGKRRQEPGKSTGDIVDHPDLSVTAMTRADSDRRDPQPGSHLRGNVRHDTLQNDGEDARRFEGQPSFDERFGLRFAASLFLVSALFSDVLWQHAEMTAKGNARANNGFDLGNLIQPALEFHRFGSGFDQSAGPGEGPRLSLLHL